MKRRLISLLSAVLLFLTAQGQQTLWDAREIRETIDLMPTVDAVPRQKYEEDMENAFAHGYTDAESKFRKMIEGGELVEVVRCKDCKEYYLPFNHMQVEQLWTCMRYGLLRNADDFCSRGERRTDETD